MKTTLFPNWTLDEIDKTGAISEYFHNEKIPFTEETMINCLKMKRNKHEIYWAVLALRMLGTQKAIQYLKEVSTYKNLDVQGASVLTIAYLAEDSENEFAKKIFARINKDFENLSPKEQKVFTVNFPHIFRN